MQSLNGEYSPGFAQVVDPQNAFLDDWTNQVAISEASRRFSRGAGMQRHGSMRITKPASTHNSPRESLTPSKRRSAMVYDSQAYRRYEQQQQQQRMYPGIDNTPRPARPARPVSWHPSSYIAPQNHYSNMNQQTACYPLSTPTMYTDHTDAESAYPQLSPVTGSYSNNTSPSSSFSIPMGGQSGAMPQYLSPDAWGAPPSNGAPYYQQGETGMPSYNEQQPPPPPPLLSHGPQYDTPAESSMDWNPQSMHAISTTTPPTPESFAPAQQTQPAVSEQYEPLPDQEEEEEGEILVGMGLYDTPEKLEQDPQLDNYRSTVTSLLGSTFRTPEPTGKGLTLEKAWEPPKSDDGEEDAEEDEPTAAAE